MNKLKETVATMFLASRYSLSFCLRNSRKATVARLIIAVLNTATAYIIIQATGLIVNAVQSSLGKFKSGTTFLEFILNDSIKNPLLFMITILLLSIAIGRFNWFYRSVWNQSLRFANQREINDHKATLDIAKFRSKEYDDLAKRIQELPASWQTRTWFSEEMLTLFTTMASFILFGISLLWYQPIYAAILIITSIPMMIVEFNFVEKWWSLFQVLVPEHKKRSVLEKPYVDKDTFVQALMFNQMPYLRKEIDNNVDGIIRGYNCIRTRSVKNEMFSHSLAIIGLCGIIAHAIWSTVIHGGSIGTFTIIIAAARTFQGNLEAVVQLIADQWNSARGVVLIEKDFFGLKPFIQTPYPVVPRFDLTPLLKFDNVSFTYPDTEVEVLKNVSFEIKPGSKVAIVGKSGHGKSTIQALMMRHYDPTIGAVYAGDVNLKNIEPKIWNNIASALTQEYTILPRKIRDEIASSKPGQIIDIDAMMDATRFSDFQEVIDGDPCGLDSQIGIEFGGREFSGGEKQRLALARVRYRGTSILILDEPDAKLDPLSANNVIDQVFGLQGVTVVIITHHVARAERCDNVIVMGSGEIMEQGTHNELMTLNGAYAKMYHQDRERLGSESESDL